MSSAHEDPRISAGYITLEKLPLVVGATFVLLALRWLAICVYNVYFHPLAHIPGPKLAAASPIYAAFFGVIGKRHEMNARLHEKYGDIVRTAPTTVSFINETAWRDIYMHRQGHLHRQMRKDFQRPAINGAWSIISAPDEDHGRIRRGLSHAFSEKALRDQEPLIKSYVDMLVKNLREDADAGREVDIVAYLNFLTFDLIADLAFAEPFDALRTRTIHPWMASFFRGIRAGVRLGQALTVLPFIRPLFSLFGPTLRKYQWRQFQYCADRVDKRIESGVDRPDLMQEVLKGNEKEDPSRQISRDEIKATFDILILAGSETTATLLSGCFYLLMTHPQIYDKLKEEVRGAFANDTEITVTKVNQLPYLLAVLEESLRVYPPVPNALGRRTPPEGASISGVWIPGDITVGVPQRAANHSPRNFVEPESFIPERFLTDKDPKFERDRKAAFQPFSAGPRNCLGRNLAYAEMKLILARCVYTFDFTLAERSRDWMKNQNSYIIWEKPPLWLEVRERQ